MSPTATALLRSRGPASTGTLNVMKIYTRTGDDGSTGLIGGKRVRKSAARIDCYGTVDELNATIGWCAVVAEPALREELELIQSELFIIGSQLAAEGGAGDVASLPALNESMVARLEGQIDAAEQLLAPLRNFILPGGSEGAARLHVARTVCRRAERLLVQLRDDNSIPVLAVAYLNRLSDWLFVQARWSNQLANVPDTLWQPSAP